MAVGAIDRYADPATFTSVGPEVEIAAPGVSILSTYTGSSVRYMSGTSMAAPHVAGAAALAHSLDPSLDGAALRSLLSDSATPLGHPANEVGAGGLDAAALLAAVGSAPAPDPEPEPPANQPPTAAFTLTCTDLTCTVDGTGSSDPDGDALAYAWTFGDGATASGPTASHTYAADGTYTVTLSVTDPGGASDSASQVVTVTAPAPEPDPEPESSPTLSVASIDHATKGPHLAMTVAIVDGAGAPVEGASVTARTCQGTTCNVWTSTTDSQGVAGDRWHKAGGGTYTTCVLEVAQGGSTWSDAPEVCTTSTA